MDWMDWRLLVVLLPLIIAGGWAVFNIGALAIQQVQKFLNKEA
jgi:photosystem II PsbY protein